MAYCTIADLTPFLVNPLTDSSRPSIDQVTAFIADVDGQLNMAMDKVGMDTPPTDANVLLWLKSASRNGVLAMIGVFTKWTSMYFCPYLLFCHSYL